MKKVILIIFSILFFVKINAQEFEYGIQAALNRTFIRLSSEHNISSMYKVDPESSTNKNIGGGGQIGTSLILRFDKFSVRNFLGIHYTNYKYKPETKFRDRSGNEIGSYESQIRNFSIQFNPVFTWDLKNGIFAGAGTSISYLLRSQHENIGISNIKTEKKWISNYQYKRLMVAAPIVLGYEWKRNSIFLSYSFGLSNKNFKEAFIKEREDNLLLGYNLVI